MEQLKDFFKNEEITSIIDVGAGTGDFVAVLKSVFPKAEITGIDPDGASLEKARENRNLVRVDSDYKETWPQLLVNIDKNRAADLGVSWRSRSCLPHRERRESIR